MNDIYWWNSFILILKINGLLLILILFLFMFSLICNCVSRRLDECSTITQICWSEDFVFIRIEKITWSNVFMQFRCKCHIRKNICKCKYFIHKQESAIDWKEHEQKLLLWWNPYSGNCPEVGFCILLCSTFPGKKLRQR